LATVNPYCTPEDVEKILPTIANIESGNLLLNDLDLDSYCLSVSAEMDNRFAQNGYETPIVLGDSLLAINMKRIATIGAAGMITRAINPQAEDQYEKNYYENQFFQELSAIVKKGFPSPVKRTITNSQAKAPSIKGSNTVWFTKEGINRGSK